MVCESAMYCDMIWLEYVSLEYNFQLFNKISLIIQSQIQEACINSDVVTAGTFHPKYNIDFASSSSKSLFYQKIDLLVQVLILIKKKKYGRLTNLNVQCDEIT